MPYFLWCLSRSLFLSLSLCPLSGSVYKGDSKIFDPGLVRRGWKDRCLVTLRSSRIVQFRAAAKHTRRAVIYLSFHRRVTKVRVCDRWNSSVEIIIVNTYSAFAAKGRRQRNVNTDTYCAFPLARVSCTYGMRVGTTDVTILIIILTCIPMTRLCSYGRLRISMYPIIILRMYNSESWWWLGL